MGRPVTLRIAYCDLTRLSEDEPDEYETVVHPVSGLAVRLYVHLVLIGYIPWLICILDDVYFQCRRGPLSYLRENFERGA